ncbi:MAG: methionyl-tRNA formyltransferase [Planctomycetaceae bacterium]
MAPQLRILMMGTGRFAVPTFEALLNSRHTVVGLITQPDRVARGRRKHVNPMKQLAEQHDVPVFPPPNVNEPEAVEQVKAFDAELSVVAAYGQILSADVIEAPRLGSINLHASLLPKYRGAAPIQHAILNGETETGITIFQIEPRLDAGPLLGVVRTEIGDDETYGELEERLMLLGPPLAMKVVDQLAAGTTEPLVQDKSAVTKARSLKKGFGEIDWTKSMHEVHCHIRGTQPWPRPFSFLHRPEHPTARLLILKAQPKDGILEEGLEPGAARVEAGKLWIACSDGWLPILIVQPEGKRAMEVDVFLRGNAISQDARFGPEDSGSNQTTE